MTALGRWASGALEQTLMARAGAVAPGPPAAGLTRPDPAKPEGTDLLPQIEHIVVLMMENHSFDNYLGMLGRGDGFTLGQDGRPAISNPDSAGTPVEAFHFESTKQIPHVPTQSWVASHLQLDGGTCQGFVKSVETSGLKGDPKVVMGYWTGEDIPFYYGLAKTFPLADRWFSSCLGPTFPNRRFLIAGTAHGLIDDDPLVMLDRPGAGLIFDRLTRNRLTWRNYHSSEKLGLFGPRRKRLLKAIESKVQFTADVYPMGFFSYLAHVRPVSEFLAAAREGKLPAVAIVDPNLQERSEENPQDIQLGEAFSAQVINAVMHGKAWEKTFLVWIYDEHGGYYDHVAPPAAPDPDGVPPRDRPEERYDRYGFRIPAVIVSPYARRDYVSHVVRDHTSVLKLIERKWNLPPLTQRDAAADDLLDCVDFDSPPPFLVPPELPAPALSAKG